MTIGIVGLGSIGQRHVKNIRVLRGSPTYNVQEIDVSQTRQPLQELLYGRNIECVFICNPTVHHWDWIACGLEGNCHVFIEKPVVDVGTNGRIDPSSILMLKRPDRAVQVGYQWRFHPTLYTILAELCGNAIGDVLSAHLVNREHLPDAHPWEDYRTGYAARHDLGGGVLSCYSHEFDLARFLFGHPQTVQATGGRSSALETDVEDTASVLWTYTPGNILAHVTFDLSFVGPKPERWMQIVGIDGSMTWDLIRQDLTYNCPARSGPFETTVHQFVERNDLYLAELREFFACMDEERQPRTSLEDGLAVSQLIGLAKESLSGGR